MKQLIEAKEARQLIADNLPKIPAIDCPLDKCASRVLRQEIVTDRPFPPFDRVMMDGFALRADEVKKGAVFKITASAPAGAAKVSNRSSANSCVEIMTGAILPEGSDCIIPVEDTERVDEDHIRITDEAPVQAGDFVHRMGSDLEAGKVLLHEGTLLGSREIAAAATCGYAKLEVSRIPSIAIACTGDELVEVDHTPEAHQIRRSNDYCIETGLSNAHLNAAERTHLPDDIEVAQARLKELVEKNDFVILSGGISMGKKDYIPKLLDELGLSCHFHGVAQKPGKPMGYWSHQTCAVFALPGNPLSTLACLHHYVIPGIRQAMGFKESTPTRSSKLISPAKVRKDLTVFLPVTLSSDSMATPSPAQNSGDLVRILESDGYIEIPSGEEAQEGHNYIFRPWL